MWVWEEYYVVVVNYSIVFRVKYICYCCCLFLYNTILPLLHSSKSRTVLLLPLCPLSGTACVHACLDTASGRAQHKKTPQRMCIQKTIFKNSPRCLLVLGPAACELSTSQLPPISHLLAASLPTSDQPAPLAAPGPQAPYLCSQSHAVQSLQPWCGGGVRVSVSE